MEVRAKNRNNFYLLGQHCVMLSYGPWRSVRMRLGLASAPHVIFSVSP